MNPFRQFCCIQLITAAVLCAVFVSCRKNLAEEPVADPSAATAAPSANEALGATRIPYRAEEAIIVYPDRTTEAGRRKIRQKLFGNIPVTVRPCACDPNIETVKGTGLDKTVDSMIIHGPGSQLSPTSTTVGVSGPDDPVIVSKNLVLTNPGTTAGTQIFKLNYTARRGPVKVAVVDTGLDTLNFFTPASLHRFLLPATEVNYKMAGIPPAKLATVYKSRFFGWNFIAGNQDVMDDHTRLKHGTNVTGLILQQAAKGGAGPVIVPLKVFDASGNAALSAILCALRFSEGIQAQIVNASWGYSGEKNVALEEAVRRLEARKILLVAAAGNDHRNIGKFLHYPACFSQGRKGLGNVITITSATRNVCGGNNFSNLHVDAGVSGRASGCAMISPFTAKPLPSCTSFATAVMTGIIARDFFGSPAKSSGPCSVPAALPLFSGGPIKEEVLARVLPAGVRDPVLSTEVRTGKRVAQ